jgi:hypothetical protein
VLRRYNHQLDDSDVLDNVSLSHLQKQLRQENQMSKPDSLSSDEMDNVP